MATWNSRGLRGSALEDLINRTNEKCLKNRAESLFLLFIIHIKNFFIICLMKCFAFFGIGQERAEGKAFVLRN